MEGSRPGGNLAAVLSAQAGGPAAGAGLGLHLVTALAALLTINVAALSLPGILTTIFAAVLVSLALASLGRPRLWFGATAFLGLLIVVFYLPPPGAGGTLAVLSTLAYWLLRFSVALFAATYVILTVSPSELVAALYRARIPRVLTVPLTVMLRFVPRVREEFGAVREAMMLRGIPLGPGAWAVHPLRTIEYLVVPLLVSCSRIADDLTASGLVRGLGGSARPTALLSGRFTWRDAAGLLAVAALIGLAVFDRSAFG